MDSSRWSVWGMFLRRLLVGVSYFSEPPSPSDPGAVTNPDDLSFTLPNTERTPPEQRPTPLGGDSSWQDAPTRYVQQPDSLPTWQREPTWPPNQSRLPRRRQSPLLWAVITLGVLVIVLAGALTYIGLAGARQTGPLGNTSGAHGTIRVTVTVTRQTTRGANATVSPTAGNATPTPDGAQPTVTATAGAVGQRFQAGQTYTYNDIIGHSKQTALTNSDINVSLVSMTLDGASHQTTLTIAFQNLDTLKSGDFLFTQANNISLIDQQGTRYQATQANPAEAHVPPQQTVTMTVTLPLVSASATQLQLYFNSDYNSLDTSCALLFPSQLAQTC